MTNVLDGLTAKLTHVPARYADEAAAVFTVYAERNGGRMLGRYQLTAAEKKRYVYDEGCTLIMEGVPSGFWTWRETGTRPHEIRAKSRRKAKRKPNPRGHGATRNHRPTYTGRPAKRRRKAKKMPGRLAINGGHPITGGVHHRGSRGKQLWTKTVDEVTPKLDAALQLALSQAAGH